MAGDAVAAARPRCYARRGVIVGVAAGVIAILIVCAVPIVDAALRNLGMVYLGKGLLGPAPVAIDRGRADELFGRTAPLGTDGSRGKAAMALLAIERGDQAAATGLVDDLLALPATRDRDMSLMAVAGAYWRAGNFKRWEALSEGVGPASAQWYVEGAKRLEVAGLLDEAEDLYRDVVAIHPESVPARIAWASFLQFYRHDTPGVIAQYEAIVRLDPSPGNMIALAQPYLWSGRYGDGLALIDRVRTEYPTYPEDVIASELAKVRLAQGDAAEAGRIVDAAIASHTDSPLLWRRRSEVYEASGRADEAVSAAHRAVELAPGSVPENWRAAELLLALHRPAEAEEYLRAILATSVRGERMGVLALIGLGTAYAQAGREDLSLRTFCQARDLNRWGERAEYVEQQIANLGGCARR